MSRSFSRREWRRLQSDSRCASQKKLDREVPVTYAAIRRQRHLVRPLPIHLYLAQLAFAIDHGVSAGGRRPRSTLLAANGEGHAFTEAGGVDSSVADKNRKGT
jgi:hypothetical protein